MKDVPIDEVLVLTSYADVSSVLRGVGWSNDPRLHYDAPPEAAKIPPIFLMFFDEVDHHRVREILNPTFTRSALEPIRPLISTIVDAVLDGLAEETSDIVDLVHNYSELIPLAVLSELLDVGPEAAEAIRIHTADVVKILQVGSNAADLADSIDAAFELTAVFTPLIVDRQKRPGNDLISGLLAYGGVTVDEVLAICMILLAAGYETPADTISNGVLALLRQPDQRKYLFADPARAVEELLRVAGSIRLLKRTALIDQKIGDLDIPTGTTVVVDLHRANTDPRRYADPERMDLTRQPRAHVGLGKGAHMCLGATLGRIQTGEALTRLFTRFPDIRLVDSHRPQWRTMKELQGLLALPVKLGPEFRGAPELGADR
ncbi:cytochrome P450 [Nocardia sp. NBC_01499]|uniref:cytochrome P450 n=1 Tax=Nocardia sp. NBC_01499 TaxID=2903597 RepID=UPI003863941D